MPTTTRNPTPAATRAEVLKTREVMERLRVKDPDTLYALVKAKRLRAVKLGREYRFTDTAVQAFLDGGGVDEQEQQESAAARIRNAKPEAIKNAPRTLRR